MKIEQSKLISDLEQRTQDVIKQATAFQSLDLELLNWKPGEGRWSVLECLEHLNYYGDFYLTEIERRIDAGVEKGGDYFHSSWFGNYFATSMLPKDGKIKKIKTFPSKNPASNEPLPLSTIDKFLEQQRQMLLLLHKAKDKDLNKIKTSIAIPVFKIKLGDTFRVVIYHNQRHILQANNVLKQQQG